MPTKKSTSKQIVKESMREVFDHPPSTLKPGKSAEATRKQQIAIGLSKAKAAGADIPEKPKGKKGSRSSY